MSGRGGPPCLLKGSHKQTEAYRSYMIIQDEEKTYICYVILVSKAYTQMILGWKYLQILWFLVKALWLLKFTTSKLSSAHASRQML